MKSYLSICGDIRNHIEDLGIMSKTSLPKKSQRVFSGNNIALYEMEIISFVYTCQIFQGTFIEKKIY
jgi:hypothetical protein